MPDTTFMKITNKQIYEKLEEVCAHVKVTNGKVRLNRWIATTALSLTMLLIGIVLSHVL